MSSSATSKVAFRLVTYYAILIGGGFLIWGALPHAGGLAPTSLDALFGGGATANDLTKGAKSVAVQPLDEVTLAITVAVAMLASALLALPVAWVYLLTRAKRGYQQSVVQLLIILPLVVSGIVLLVKYSITLAFSLAGIVAAVRFRNTLDDSKDAVYVFLATALGLACAVNLPVALVISIGFNMAAIILWYTDFGNAPVELDGRIGARRLSRAKQLARTGTFVAKIDDEVFRNMTREQLEGVAERAWKRASSTEDDGKTTADESRLHISTADVAGMRRIVEPKLQDYAKAWRLGAVTKTGNTESVEYYVQFKKRTPPEELLSLLRASAASVITEMRIL